MWDKYLSLIVKYVNFPKFDESYYFMKLARIREGELEIENSVCRVNELESLTKNSENNEEPCELLENIESMDEVENEYIRKNILEILEEMNIEYSKQELETIKTILKSNSFEKNISNPFEDSILDYMSEEENINTIYEYTCYTKEINFDKVKRFFEVNELKDLTAIKVEKAFCDLVYRIIGVFPKWFYDVLDDGVYISPAFMRKFKVDSFFDSIYETVEVIYKNVGKIKYKYYAFGLYPIEGKSERYDLKEDADSSELVLFIINVPESENNFNKKLFKAFEEDYDVQIVDTFYQEGFYFVIAQR